jgi:TonB-dependent SusC/RagA subfamily outer membrane receptor
MTRTLIAVACLTLLAAANAAGQTRKVQGKIMVEGSQQPLAGASVMVIGSKAGTCTGFDGNFVVDVPQGEVTLQVSVPGWMGEAVVGPDQSEITLQLERGVIELPEMVVTGQATSVSKRQSANAVARLDGAQLNRVPAQTVESAMQGKVVGANIRANSGAPGGGVQMQFRGLTSILGSSDPLIVLDGVIVSNAAIPPGTHYITGVSPSQSNPVNRLADINPNDIESIEILKGASAAAIYGSRASNGVVIITTKHGVARYEQEQPRAEVTLTCAPGARGK